MKWRRCLLKPIDKVGVRPVEEYPGSKERERRSSLVKDEEPLASLTIVGEGNSLLPKLAEREKDKGGGISGDTDRKRHYQLGKPSSSLEETTGAR